MFDAAVRLAPSAAYLESFPGSCTVPSTIVATVSVNKSLSASAEILFPTSQPAPHSFRASRRCKRRELVRRGMCNQPTKPSHYYFWFKAQAKGSRGWADAKGLSMSRASLDMGGWSIVGIRTTAMPHPFPAQQCASALHQAHLPGPAAKLRLATDVDEPGGVRGGHSCEPLDLHAFDGGHPRGDKLQGAVDFARRSQICFEQQPL